jgi:hypothetical protein
VARCSCREPMRRPTQSEATNAERGDSATQVHRRSGKGRAARVGWPREGRPPAGRGLVAEGRANWDCRGGAAEQSSEGDHRRRTSG